MDKSLMFGKAKYIITGFKTPLDQIYTFQHRKDAEQKLQELRKQFPDETEVHIEEI